MESKSANGKRALRTANNGVASPKAKSAPKKINAKDKKNVDAEMATDENIVEQPESTADVVVNEPEAAKPKPVKKGASVGRGVAKAKTTTVAELSDIDDVNTDVAPPKAKAKAAPKKSAKGKKNVDMDENAIEAQESDDDEPETAKPVKKSSARAVGGRITKPKAIPTVELSDKAESTDEESKPVKKRVVVNKKDKETKQEEPSEKVASKRGKGKKEEATVAPMEVKEADVASSSKGGLKKGPMKNTNSEVVKEAEPAEPKTTVKAKGGKKAKEESSEDVAEVGKSKKAKKV